MSWLYPLELAWTGESLIQPSQRVGYLTTGYVGKLGFTAWA